ncbi:MAG: EAL domain-containing protein [Desulfococcaceae bacterium]
MENYLHFLKNVSFFSSLPDPDILKISAVCGKTALDAGKVVFSEGTRGQHFYIILKGAVEIVKDQGEQGQDRIAVYKQGQCFGELALIDDFPRSATVLTTEPSELLCISRDDFQKVVQESASISFSILKTLTGLIRERTENFIDDLRERNRNLERAYARLKREIEDRRRAEKRLHHQAFHDSLTGLPNRALFLNRLQEVLKEARQKKSSNYAILYLDVDRFNAINDRFGHLTGDQVLIKISERLRNCLRRSEILARFSGDEFAVLLEGTCEAEDPIRIAQRIKEELREPFAVSGKEMYITVCTGIVPGGDKYNSTVDVLRDADIAMYGAKAKGVAEIQTYDEALHEKTMDLLRLETDMKGAVERREFILEYQPIIRMKNCELAGFETLVRWIHPERGVISPEIFIPLAEKTGYILELGRWIISDACAQVRQWIREAEPGRHFFVNINISGKQFLQPEFIDEFQNILDKAEIPGEYLKVEMTESVLIENVDYLVDVLSRLRKMNVKIALDDFGTGYSSLSYLYKFPIDVLKIDRSFVFRMGESGEKDLVPVIISIAHSMKMDVVAEGVETVKQFQQLLSYGCEYGQGFLFSKSMRKGDAGRLLLDGSERDICVWPGMQPEIRNEN